VRPEAPLRRSREPCTKGKEGHPGGPQIRVACSFCQPALRAQHLCPDAVFIPPDFTRYKAVSRGVRDILERHTDLIEPLSLDEAYLDVTENQSALPTATLLAKTIRQQIRDELHLTASAGVAPNKFLSKIASDWRDVQHQDK
jgi:DNA polymerase IV